MPRGKGARSGGSDLEQGWVGPPGVWKEARLLATKECLAASPWPRRTRCYGEEAELL